MPWTSRLRSNYSSSFLAVAATAAAASSLAIALSLRPLDLGAQVLEPGVRVRVTQANGIRHDGIFQGLEADSARITASRGAMVAIPLSDVRRLEVSTGRHRRFWKNFGLATAGAAALGAGISAATYEPCNDEVLFGCLVSPSSRTEAFMWGAVAGGMIGVPVAVVVGAAVRQEQWAPVFHRLVAPARVSVRPVLGRRVGAVATITLD